MKLDERVYVCRMASDARVPNYDFTHTEGPAGIIITAHASGRAIIPARQLRAYLKRLDAGKKGAK